MGTRPAQASVSSSGRLVPRVRWIAIRGLAAAAAGVLVLGVGGRLVMFASRLLHPDAVGRITENGNRIGEFTFDGTIGLILFSGLGSGLIAAAVWVFVKEWIPDSPVLVGFGSLAIGGFFLIEADNQDFVILVDPRADLVLLLGLLFTFGVVLYWFDRWLDHRLSSNGGTGSTVAYSVIAALGVPLLIPTFGNFFSKEFCFCESPPIWTGVFLVIAAVATIAWWVLDFRGVTSPPLALKWVGLLSVAGAAVTGGLLLAEQLIAIL